MIQFNLLPDVKLQYLKSQRYKRLVMSISMIAGSASLAVFILLFFAVNVVQKQHMKNLDKDIKASSSKLQSIPDLDKILTVQNQLNSLPALHDQKPAVTRLFSYLTMVTPNDVTISTLTVDYTQNTIRFEGKAPELGVVNKFVDTLKFTQLSGDDPSLTGREAFTNVVMSNFGRSEDGAVYQIDLVFEPVIFDNTKSARLNVPSLVTTRSSTERPAALFEESSEEKRE